MKFLKFILVTVVICYILAVGYNFITIHNLDNKDIEKDSLSLSIEIASRLGIGQTLGLIGELINTNDTASVLRNSRASREIVNVLFDWYAPIKLSPVLSVSKEIGWLFFQDKLNKYNL
jgi:hypothetical protein